MFAEQKWPMAKQVHHNMHEQCCKWSHLLHNYVFTKRGEQKALGRESLTTAILVNCCFPTFHPFGVSHLTIYTQSTFCYILLVSNTGLGPTSHSKSRGYSNRLLGHKLYSQYIAKPNAGYWMGDPHTRGLGTHHPGYNLELILQSLPPWGEESDPPYLPSMAKSSLPSVLVKSQLEWAAGYCHGDPYPGSNTDAVA